MQESTDLGAKARRHTKADLRLAEAIRKLKKLHKLHLKGLWRMLVNNSALPQAIHNHEVKGASPSLLSAMRAVHAKALGYKSGYQ